MPPPVLLHHSPNQKKFLATSCVTTSARENTISPPRTGNSASTSLTAGLPSRERRPQSPPSQSSSIPVQKRHHPKSKMPPPAPGSLGRHHSATSPAALRHRTTPGDRRPFRRRRSRNPKGETAGRTGEMNNAFPGAVEPGTRVKAGEKASQERTSWMTCPWAFVSLLSRPLWE